MPLGKLQVLLVDGITPFPPPPAKQLACNLDIRVRFFLLLCDVQEILTRCVVRYPEIADDILVIVISAYGVLVVTAHDLVLIHTYDVLSFVPFCHRCAPR